MIRVRFAPSPTGELHIGSARTALFNWLYARHTDGKFLLRIEDTDVLRSTPENTKAIFEAMEWLGIHYDEEAVFQSKNIKQHQEIVNQMLENGSAYKCYCAKEELEEIRKAYGKYNGKCRRHPERSEGSPYVVRLKSSDEGSITIHDEVQGEITVKTETLDDMILLRQDGTPTYMLSVVVDDHDMKITHVIRGDDHLTNAFRQYQIYKAMGWDVPKFVHVPLIHGTHGGKLSKREGAVGVQSFRDEGILPEALFNYLLRLGWSHGDDEIISKDSAIKWFDIKGLGKSPSKFDRDKLLFLNAHYIKEKDNEELFKLMDLQVSDAERIRIVKGLGGLKVRAKTLVELRESAKVYMDVPIDMTEDAKKVEIDKTLMAKYCEALSAEASSRSEAQSVEHPGSIQRLMDPGSLASPNPGMTTADLLDFTKSFAKEHEVKLGVIAQYIRVLLTGSTISPSVFEIMEVWGKDEVLKKMNFANR